MEELLKKLETGFKAEADSFVESVKARNVSVVSYHADLMKLQAKIREISQQLRTDVLDLQKQKNDLSDEMAGLKVTHSKMVESHTSIVDQKKADSLKLDREIQDKNQKSLSIDNYNLGLISEKKQLEAYNLEKRGENQILDRSNRELKIQERGLLDSIEAKKTEDLDLEHKLEAKRKEYTKITTEVAIQAKRKAK